MQPHEPPTLQDQCLLRLVRRLEEYPLTALASLPLHLRLALLRNLPAADVYQLEHTAVTEGIDMDLSLWKKTRTGCLRTTVRSGELWEPSDDCTPTFKQKYFADLYTILLLGEFQTARRMLFSFLVVRGWKPFEYMFRDSFPIPSRHYCEKSTCRVLSKVLLFAVQNPDSRPVGIAVDCSRFIKTALWCDRDFVMSNLLGVVFSNMKSFVFSEGFIGGEEAVKVLRFLLQVVLTRPNPVLTCLSLSGSSDFLRHAFLDASVFFSSSSHNRLLWAQCYPQMVSGYSGLASIHITHEDGIIFVENECIIPSICAVVLHQSSLEWLSLEYNFSACNSAQSLLTLCDALGKLFLQPQFKALQLFATKLDWKCLSSLLLPFFASSVCDQKLHLEGVDFELKELNQPIDVLPALTSSRGRGKVLNLLRVVASDPVHLVPFFRWLSQCQCAQVCSSFEFVYRIVFPFPVVEITVPFMDLMTEVPQFERFVMCEVSLLVEPSPVVSFCNLFRGPHLKSVAFRYCEIGEAGLLPCLTQGLLKQIPHGQLEDLDLQGNQLGTAIDADFQDFCEAVFSLPQVTNLALNVEMNQLKPHHYSIISDAWKTKASHRKIRSFQAQNGNDCEDEMSQFLIHDIAVTQAN